MENLLLDFLMGNDQALPISKREKECLKYIKSGYTAKEIARQMSISYRTVQNHVENIKAKLGCQNQSQLITLLHQFISKTLINYLPHAIFLKDNNSVFLDCNKKFAEFCGLDLPLQVIGKTDYEMPWSKEQTDKYIIDDQEIIKTGLPRLNYEEKQQRVNGVERIGLVSKVPVYNNDNNVIGVLGIYTDITDKKKVEQEFLIAKEKQMAAEAANKAKSKLLENMRRDAHVPLSGIVDFAKIIKEEADNPKIKEYAARILASSDSLQGVLDEY
jgi:two-component system, OmpR family, aerobic respiration control sensor histidine kinase ArcB